MDPSVFKSLQYYEENRKLIRRIDGRLFHRHKLSSSLFYCKKKCKNGLFDYLIYIFNGHGKLFVGFCNWFSINSGEDGFFICKNKILCDKI